MHDNYMNLFIILISADFATDWALHSPLSLEKFRRNFISHESNLVNFRNATALKRATILLYEHYSRVFLMHF